MGAIVVVLNHYLEAAQRAFNEAAEEGVRSAIDRGYLPESSMDRHRASLQYTAIRTTTPSVMEAELYRSGHYDSYRNEIVAHDSATDGDIAEQTHTVGHERGHDMSGGTFIRMPDGSIYRSRVGFNNDRDLAGRPEEYENHGLFVNLLGMKLPMNTRL